MKRGDVYRYVGPKTPVEGEHKHRTVIIVSPDEYNDNDNHPYVSVVPTTTRNLNRIYAFEVDLGEHLDRPCKAQTQYIYSCKKACPIVLL